MVSITVMGLSTCVALFRFQKNVFALVSRHELVSLTSSFSSVLMKVSRAAVRLRSTRMNAKGETTNSNTTGLA